MTSAPAGGRWGLSPRVRGKRPHPRIGAGGVRSIPACAGEAAPGLWTPCRRRVYPRVCGGSAAAASVVAAKPGLSPRVRGKPNGVQHILEVRGSIPACAGEATYRRQAAITMAVYPRVCGGSPGRRP